MSAVPRGGKAARKPSGRFSGWATHHNWEQRARAFDARMAAVEQQAAEKVAAKDGFDWAKRKTAWRENQMALAEKLSKRSSDLLNLPIVRQITSRDGSAITIEPVAASHMTAAAQLARAGAEVFSNVEESMKISGELSFRGGLTVSALDALLRD